MRDADFCRLTASASYTRRSSFGVEVVLRSNENDAMEYDNDSFDDDDEEEDDDEADDFPPESPEAQTVTRGRNRGAGPKERPN